MRADLQEHDKVVVTGATANIVRAIARGHAGVREVGQGSFITGKSPSLDGRALT